MPRPPLPQPEFLPATAAEGRRLGWDPFDVILVSGDAYIDSAYNGVAVIGRTLVAAGYKVGIIAQPDIAGLDDIRRLGAPRLFWGVSGGCVDSLVANTTASLKRRRQDDFTPGGENTRRPDRAVLQYANLIRRAFRPCAPIVLGGVEASLRRIAHYDYWSDSVRRSLLLDAKADILVYGMGERTVAAVADALDQGTAWRDLRGICHAAPEPPPDALLLPDYAIVAGRDATAKAAFIEMFRTFSANQDALTAKPLAQRHDTRFLVHNPPAPPLSTDELDRAHELPFANEAHPHDRAQGEIRALDTIRFSLLTHRGCYGACRFCAIAVHQGRRVVSRSEASLVREVQRLARHPKFRGIISDAGGPTANMYGFECARKCAAGACADRDCLFPRVCPGLKPDHEPLTRLLRTLRGLPGIRKVFSASGIRPDLLAADSRHGEAYLEELVRHHVSGQLKLAPEHADPEVLALMGKPDITATESFIRRFGLLNERLGLRQFLTSYFIAAHPGCTLDQMRRLRKTAQQRLGLVPEQVQIFTPTPSTWSTVMYWTEQDPFTGRPIFVEKGLRAKTDQKAALTE